MIDDRTSSVRRNHCMDSNIPLIHYCKSTVVHVQVDSFCLHPAHCNDANGIEPGSNSKMTDKHAAESKMYATTRNRSNQNPDPALKTKTGNN